MPVAEITKVQTVLISQTTLTSPLPQSYDTYRIIRRNPTVALARALSVAPIIAGQWSIEADDEVDDDKIKFVKDEFIPIREPFLETALNGGIDFGWQPFEVVYIEKNGLIGLSKLKPLLHDLTTIMVNESTGAFDGFLQDAIDISDVRVPVEQSLNVHFRVEGTNWYGSSLLENARLPFNKWTEASEGAGRYDKKMAGSHFVVHYPMGSSPDSDGNETPNDELAKTILQSLESSGSVAIPHMISEFEHELKDAQVGWKIEILSDNSPKQASFNDRLNYLDKQMVRAVLVPERAILEGQFGTKAEAGQHADLALTHMDLTHRHVTRLCNWHVLDRLLVMNWGEEARGTIRLLAAPLADDMRAYLRSIYEKLLTSPQGFAEEFPNIDTDSLKDSIGIPKSEEVADTGDDLLDEDFEIDDGEDDTLAKDMRRIMEDVEVNSE